MNNRPPQPASSASESQRIVRNSVFNLVGMGLIIPLNFVALFTLARRLGKESLGVFFTLFAISAVIFLLVGSGTTTVLTRRVAQSRQQMRRIIGEAAGVLVMVCLGSIVMFVLAAGGWFVWQGVGGWPLLVIAAVALSSRHTLEFQAAAMRGVERFEFENMARVLQTGLFCGLVMTVVDDSPRGAAAAYASYAVSNLVAVLVLAVLMVVRWDCRSFHLNAAVLRDWFAESWPIGLGDVLRRAAWQSETLLLAALQTPAAVGLYSLAYRPLQPLQILPRSLVSVTFPQMTRQVGDPGAVRRMVDDATALLWLLSLPIAVAVTVCAKPLIELTAGAEYGEAAVLLQSLIWLTGFTFLNTQVRFVLAAVGRERAYGASCGVVLVLKVAAGALLISGWGIYGACAAALVGEAAFTAAGFGLLIAGGLARIPWLRLAASTAAAAAMAAALLPLSAAVQSRGPAVALLWLLPASGAASLLYLLLCVLFGALPLNQVKRLRDGLTAMVRRRAARAAAPSQTPSETPQIFDEVTDRNQSDAQLSDKVAAGDGSAYREQAGADGQKPQTVARPCREPL